jgi:hypothetical protein
VTRFAQMPKADPIAATPGLLQSPPCRKEA